MDFKFRSRIRVQFRDCDLLGHVNNAVYLSYLEQARMDFYDHVFGREGFQRFPYIIGQVNITYRSPAHLKEHLLVGIGVTDIGRRSFGFAYEIAEESTGRLVAVARTRQVMYHYERGEVYEIPEEWKKSMAPYVVR